MKATDAILMITDEYLAAVEKHADFKSLHDGYAVLLEETEELWDDIKATKKHKDMTQAEIEKMRKEAAQAAAMGLRFMVDLL